MKKWIGPLSVMLVVALASHLVLSIAAPKLIMGLAIKKMKKTACDTAVKRRVDMANFTAVNCILPAERRTAETKEVVAPNPNMLFSVILYDVSQKPLLIESPVPTTYWSISFYADNTDNYFILNDRQVNANSVKLLLTNGKDPVPRIEGTQVVKAQSNKGVVLFRYLIKDEAHFKEIDKLRQTTLVKPL